MSCFMDEWTIDGKIRQDRFGDLLQIHRDTETGRETSCLRVLKFPESEEEYEAVKMTVLDESELRTYFYEMVDRTKVECQVMDLLKENGNVIRYEECDVVENEDRFGWTVYIRIELQRPLLSYVKDHPLTVGDVVRLGIDISHALEGCRQYEIIHRNVCPETIFVTDDGHFKLGGFDIAHEREKVRSDHKQEKPGNYMSPEQYGGKNYSYASDMYSLGLIMYRFLNRDRLPFLPPDPEPIRYFDREEARKKLLDGRPLPDPIDATTELAEIVKKACAYRPENRYGSAAEMRQALERMGKV